MYDFKASYDAMQKASRIGIFTHSNVDGDAVGSAFALYYYLTGLGKEVEVIAETTLPNQLEFLNIAHLIKKEPTIKYDLVIATDCGTIDLMGVNKQKFAQCANSIQFDHHPLNPEFARINNIETRVTSASEIVAKFFLDQNIEIKDREVELLLSGIITDSGGFKFSCTTAETLKVVSELLSKSKIEISDIMHNLFESETVDSFKMQQYAMNHTEFLFNGQAVIIKIDYSFFKNTGVDPNACKFLTRIGTELKDVKLTALVSEVSPNVNKVSFRSKQGYDASACARVFGGGGHQLASGCKIFGKFYDVVDKLKKAMGDQLGC